MMITVTERAAEKLRDVLTTEQKANHGLRVYVTGGGCHGFQYGMAIEEQPGDEDHTVEAHGVKLFVDPQSAPLLAGAEVDFVDGLQGAGFSIKNPKAKSTCGCGNSFGA
jgi:iron-sulfur cluster insertion protein